MLIRQGWAGHSHGFSSLGSDFNWDFGVSFTPQQLADREAFYNYQLGTFPVEEAPGLSVFAKDETGLIYHTYSCYARGLDMLNGAYNHLDLTPKGRDEDNLPNPMAWLHHHDRYPSES